MPPSAHHCRRPGNKPSPLDSLRWFRTKLVLMQSNDTKSDSTLRFSFFGFRADVSVCKAILHCIFPSSRMIPAGFLTLTLTVGSKAAFDPPFAKPALPPAIGRIMKSRSRSFSFVSNCNVIGFHRRDIAAATCLGPMIPALGNGIANDAAARASVAAGTAISVALRGKHAALRAIAAARRAALASSRANAAPQCATVFVPRAIVAGLGASLAALGGHRCPSEGHRWRNFRHRCGSRGHRCRLDRHRRRRRADVQA